MEPIIIDTDAGEDVDDVLAIALAARWAEVYLRAVTTVGWRADAKARLVRKLLVVAGRSDIPVAAGSPRPMTPGPLWHGIQDAQCDLVTPDEFERFAPADEGALDLLTRLIEAQPGKITVVCIGHLTNIAALLTSRPEIAPKIKRLAIMGGETAIVRRENNIAKDVIAADLVFRSGVPIFLGTWSVTRQFVIDPAGCGRIRDHGGDLTDFLHQCIDRWWPHKGGKIGPVMYDAAPIVWTARPDLFTTSPRKIRVETTGELTRGMTLIQNGEPNALVTEAMDAAAIEKLFYDVVLVPRPPA